MMKEQTFLHIMSSDGAALTRKLQAAGFRVTPSQRMSGGIHVRVREDTDDRAEVERIVEEVTPGATYGPEGAPTMNIADYRQGH